MSDTSGYQSFIGLEMHVHLLTNTKVFCRCRTTFGDEPNTNVCPICMGHPGTLPTLNEEAMRKAYLVAESLGCTLAARTTFERKNYYYPDLPKNYQISQFQHPIGRNGHVDVDVEGTLLQVGIREIHLEEDAGKMIHAGEVSLIDYNRAGTPLLEIVTEPQLTTGAQAERLLLEMRKIVRYLGVSDGNMEEGSLRCDANASVNRRGAGLGSKVEIKNMNSSRFARRALDYEIERQREVLIAGGTVVQETRLWNENRDVTESMRKKESSQDYRFFPDPDLPSFDVEEQFLREVRANLVELPLARQRRLGTQHGLESHVAAQLCEEKETADFFEETVALGADATIAAAWLLSDVKGEINHAGVGLADSPLTPKRLAQLLALLAAQTIHGKIAKQTLRVLFEEDRDPSEIIKERGWSVIADEAQLREVIAGVLAAHPAVAAQLQRGDAKPIGFLMGKVMAATSGRADPAVVRSLLADHMGKPTHQHQ